MNAERAIGPGAIVLTLVLLAYAFLSFASGMDRLSANDPSRALLVAGPLRAQAAQAQAAVALSKSEFHDAEAFAAEALSAAPGDPRVLGALASAQVLQGEPAAGHRAFEVARAAGWRDAAVQAYWAREGLAQGDAQSAIRHLEALLRARPFLPAAEQLLAAAASDAEVRSALLARAMAHEPFARELFAVDSSDLSSSVALRGELLLDPQMEAQPYGCSLAGGVIEGLAERQMSDQADAVAARHCPI